LKDITVHFYLHYIEDINGILAQVLNERADCDKLGAFCKSAINHAEDTSMMRAKSNEDDIT